jgi:hypothetical protein
MTTMEGGNAKGLSGTTLVKSKQSLTRLCLEN